MCPMRRTCLQAAFFALCSEDPRDADTRVESTSSSHFLRHCGATSTHASPHLSLRKANQSKDFFHGAVVCVQAVPLALLSSCAFYHIRSEEARGESPLQNQASMRASRVGGRRWPGQALRARVRASMPMRVCGGSRKPRGGRTISSIAGPQSRCSIVNKPACARIRWAWIMRTPAACVLSKCRISGVLPRRHGSDDPAGDEIGGGVGGGMGASGGESGGVLPPTVELTG